MTEGVANQPGHRAIRNRRYKLIYEPHGPADAARGDDPYALFDTVADPEEESDLLAEAGSSGRVERVFERMSATLPEAVPHVAAAPEDWTALEPALKTRLEALGYGGDAFRPAPPGQGRE